MSGFEIIELNSIGPNIHEVNEDITDEKWQKLVLYYLARLKGLCDWRNTSTNNKKINAKIHAKRCSSQDLESRIIGNITQKSRSRLSKKQPGSDEIGSYIVAGYEEGKQQAVKIITRSLQYGVMAGILTKRGNCYRIAPEYLYVCKPPTKQKNKKKRKIIRRKCSVKSVKTNVRKRCAVDKKKSTTALNAKKRKENIQKSPKHRHNYDPELSDEKPPNKRNKHVSDTNVNLHESTESNTTFQTLSRSLTPIDERKNKRDVRAKRPRPRIQNPLNYMPPPKRPRSRSQSKSPSHHTDDDEVRDINANSHMIINKFRMPRPRRYSNVMSSMSSSSVGSGCKRCECDAHIDQMIKRTRRK